jgi:hypothetical protein
MGSSGSGRISDYPGTAPRGGGSDDGAGQGGGPGGGAGGGGSGRGEGQPEDRCARAFSVRLEDIEHSEYFGTHSAPPLAGETLHIRQRKRLVAETSAGLSVGNLPTSYNYLAPCLKDGWSYTGTVTASSTAPPVATVAADFAAIPKA